MDLNSEESEIIMNYLISISKQLSGEQGAVLAENISGFIANLRDKLLEKGFSRPEAIAIICRLQHLKI